MKFVQLLTISLLVTLSVSTLVSNYESCVSTCDSSRQSALSSVDLEEQAQLNQEWDTFLKCTANTDGDNVNPGTTQSTECATFQTTSANSAEKTDAKAPNFREIAYDCYSSCDSDEFEVDPNDDWNDCRSLCAGDLYSNPKVKEYIQCEQTCSSTLESNLVTEFSSNLTGLQELQTKISSLDGCAMNTQACLSFAGLKGNVEHADYFKFFVECKNTCLGSVKLYKEDAGTSLPQYYSCFGTCAKGKLNSTVDFSGILPDTPKDPETPAGSAVSSFGFLFLAVSCLILF